MKDLLNFMSNSPYLTFFIVFVVVCGIVECARALAGMFRPKKCKCCKEKKAETSTELN